jgi:uncharacterized protein YneF (UPF0154 family)
MNTRLIIAIIVICFYLNGLVTGFFLGKQTEKSKIDNKNFLIQKEINKIG